MDAPREDKLFPCPFCGAEAVLNLRPTGIAEKVLYKPSCSSLRCPVLAVGAQAFDTEAEAIAAWNRRADLAPSAQPPADSAWQPAESSAQVRREPRELDRALRSYGEGRISTGKLRELIAEWAAGKPLSPFAEPQGDESFGASAQVRRLAEALVSMCQKYEPKTEEELAAFVQAKRVLASPEAPAPDSDQIYPCADCGVMRSKAEGGTTFTVCDECWDKAHPKTAPEAPAKAWVEVQDTDYGWWASLEINGGEESISLGQFDNEESAFRRADEIAASIPGIRVRR